MNFHIAYREIVPLVVASCVCIHPQKQIIFVFPNINCAIKVSTLKKGIENNVLVFKIFILPNKRSICKFHTCRRFKMRIWKLKWHFMPCKKSVIITRAIIADFISSRLGLR